MSVLVNKPTQVSRLNPASLPYQGPPPMRTTLALIALATLAACGTGDENNFPPVCAEQAQLAQNGKVDGGAITITCPDTTE